MSYTKNNWQTGDVVTADKLNNMENGIEAASSGGGGGSSNEIVFTIGRGSSGETIVTNNKGLTFQQLMAMDLSNYKLSALLPRDGGPLNSIWVGVFTEEGVQEIDFDFMIPQWAETSLNWITFYEIRWNGETVESAQGQILPGASSN